MLTAVDRTEQKKDEERYTSHKKCRVVTRSNSCSE